MSSAPSELPPPLPVDSKTKTTGLFLVFGLLLFPFAGTIALLKAYWVFHRVVGDQLLSKGQIDVFALTPLLPIALLAVQRILPKKLPAKTLFLSATGLVILITLLNSALIVVLANDTYEKIAALRPQRGELSQPGAQPRVSESNSAKP